MYPSDLAPKPVSYLGHSRNDEGAGVPELLREHLSHVADRAARFAADFGAGQQARAAGLLHDLGKYADQFQRRLRDPREPGRDHWSVGALAALTAGRLGIVPGIAIGGHHAGLDLLADDRRLCGRILQAMQDRPEAFTESTNRSLLLQRFLADGFELPKIDAGLVPTDRFAGADMLDVRMLFSALVDADFLETEAHFNGDAQTPRRPRADGPSLDFDRAIVFLERHVARVRQEHGDAPMGAARETLYRHCLAAAIRPPGLFTLSAPTGSGKTLAMLAFALHHARRHGLRRVVLVVPFLNIIDQTAGIYRAIFSAANGFALNTVLEHHSLADHGEERTEDGADGEGQSLSRLLTENWDAPVVLTTTVQFFESLMAARTSRCRKLHRLAQSVILFDEVQTLPPALAVATLAALSRLSDPAGPYRSTVVFATATQPAFDALDGRVRPEFAAAGWQPTEIVPDAKPLYDAVAGHVRVAWQYGAPVELEELAARVQGDEQVLCIVNLKRHAAGLAEMLRDRGTEGLLHLSTNMCPAHRAKVLEAVNLRLRADLPVRLVSTQCVEAGVDLDFPVVYRALAPLEAIAQAAGRCNRHGRRATGQVVVFKLRDNGRAYPPGYGPAIDATESFLASLSGQGDLDAIEVINSPERLRAYFRHFYGLMGRISGECADEHDLLEAVRAGDFPEVAKLYKLINQDTINVLVPYDRAVFEQLRVEMDESQPRTPDSIRDWLRRAAPHAVSLFRPDEEDPIMAYLDPVQFSRRRPVELWKADWFLSLADLGYDPLMGVFKPSENLWIV